MIDSFELEQSLKQAKLGSMTDVINFIIDHLYKAFNFDPIQDLQMRVSALEKSKGLDLIMIEEVKTLIEAIFQQKQDQFKRDLKKTVHSNVSVAMQQENSRRSLRQVDFMTLINTAQQSKKPSFSVFEEKPLECHNLQSPPEIKKPSFSTNHQNKEPLFSQNTLLHKQIQSIQKQIEEIKIQLGKKHGKKQFNQFKNNFQKELINKMPIEETQRIVEKFQNQTFQKLNHNIYNMEKMEYTLRKLVVEESSIIKKQLINIIGCSNCHHLSTTSTKQKTISITQKQNEKTNTSKKIQKKIKKCEDKLLQYNQNYEIQMKFIKKQMKESFEQIFNLIESLNMKKTEIQQKQVRQFDLNFQRGEECATWLAHNKCNIKNMGICWDEEVMNSDEQIFKFQKNKSQIILLSSGYYLINCFVFGCQSSPCLVLNSQQIICRLEQRCRVPLKQKNGQREIYGCCQIIKINQDMTNNLLSIRLQKDDKFNSAIIKMTKIA